ncbi:hypothetical protein MHU86_13331 [Fragilaria crotonensis]|nr:hypothetical protein MHU86_13331 [Fragilaria crotonensis]
MLMLTLLASMVVTLIILTPAPSPAPATSSPLRLSNSLEVSTTNRDLLSTLESEYSALSASMRTLLPLRDLLGEICKELTLPPDFKSTIRCRVFEDNNGALLLATKQRLLIAPSTSWLVALLWHHVRNGDVVLKIATTDQLADYLTKGLNREVLNAFESLLVMTRGTAALVLGGFKSVPSSPASPYVYCSCPTFSPHHH